MDISLHIHFCPLLKNVRSELVWNKSVCMYSHDIFLIEYFSCVMLNNYASLDPAIPYSELPSFMSTDEDNGSPSRGHDLAPAGRGRETNGGELNPRQLLAEVLHISRPLVHSEGQLILYSWLAVRVSWFLLVFSMGIFQQTSWKPWILSLLMDVTR